MDQLIAVFCVEHFQRVASFGLVTELPVFIVGMPRSGTTLMEQILASHPQIFGAGELRDFDEMAKSLATELNRSVDYPACMSALDGQAVRRLAERQLARLKQRGGQAVRVVDKMPLNYHHLGLIATLFPRARVIHCRRHPLDTCLSSFMQYAIPSSLEDNTACLHLLGLVWYDEGEASVTSTPLGESGCQFWRGGIGFTGTSVYHFGQPKLSESTGLLPSTLSRFAQVAGDDRVTLVEDL